jgi:GR25 family glycosyltransferase involved in LPS biosynthesis
MQKELPVPPIYWINLTRREDRRQTTLSYFSKHGITNHVRITPKKDPNPVHSCMKAHIEAIYTAYKDGYNVAFFMEDDVNLEQGFSAATNAITLLPPGWEAFQFHYINFNMLDALYKSPQPNVILRGYFMSAAFYALSRKGMERILSLFGRIQEGEYTMTAKFLPSATPEELLFHYVESYLPLYPLYTTHESNTSDVDNVKNYNMRNAASIEHVHPPPPLQPIVRNLYPTSSWDSTPEEAEATIKYIFSDTKHYLSFLSGTFGQRLFQYWSIRCLAKKHGATYSVFGFQESSENDYYRNLFHINYKINPISRRELLERHTYISDASRIPEDKVCIFEGSFQSEDYLIREEVINELKEPSAFTETLNNAVKSYDNIAIISVPSPEKVKGINMKHYYEECLKKLEGYDCILVSECDANQIKEYYSYLSHIPALNTGSECIKFWFMARCKAFVTANSESAWWAAWICDREDKKVFIPSQWYPDRPDETLGMDGAEIIDM